MIAVYAMVRGAADIFTARRVQHTAKPRWLLYAGGAIGIVTALAIFFGPNHGRGIVRLSLALYLGLTGRIAACVRDLQPARGEASDARAARRIRGRIPLA